MAVGSVCLTVIGTFKQEEMLVEKCVKLNGIQC
jgi:hypothetical protein